MQTRPFGSTGHHSTVAIFGSAAFWSVSQAEADRTMQLLIQHGVNHIDVPPSYGIAEERLGPWIAEERERFFLGCKTMERTKASALAEMQRSLQRLQTDYFDLYQIHAITSMQDLDAATRTGGALDALIEARQAGLARYLGITGHGLESPSIFIEALQRFNFDSVLFPLNFVQYREPRFRQAAGELLALCQERGVAVMIIKSITRGPWGDLPKKYTTWYQPFDEPHMIQQAVDFALSQPGVSGICTAGDTRLLPLVLQACENFSPMPPEDQEAAIASAASYQPLFT